MPPLRCPIKSLTQEESYEQRRQLFKNIWKTAMQISHNSPNPGAILNKPKIIKTLCMDQVDQSPVGKPKKERIRNLRHVCNKILDFCDKQEAEDAFYLKVKADKSDSSDKPVAKPRRMKIGTRKTKRAKSKFTANTNVNMARNDVGLNKDEHKSQETRTVNVPRKLSPIRKTNRPKVLRMTKKSPRSKSNSKQPASSELKNDIPTEASTSRRRNLKKKVKIKEAFNNYFRLGIKQPS